MWYVIQVFAGREDEACTLIELHAGGVMSHDGRRVLKECFVPRYQVERKFHGAYRTIEVSLFPGYVIASTNRVDELNELLRGVPRFTKILGSDELFIPLDRTEMSFINSFTTEKHRVIRMSKAVKVGDRVVVVEGPMIGREGWITKINRRKGTARIETSAFGRTLSVEIGLSVVSERDPRA